MKAIYFCFFGLLTFSCSDGKKSFSTSPLDIFPETVQVTLKDLEIDENLLFNPYWVTAIDTFLIVSVLHKNNETEYNFRLFSAISEKFIRSFGAVGRGPDEFESYPSVSRVYTGSGEELLGIFEKNNFKYTLFSIDSLLYSKNGLGTVKSVNEIHFDVFKAHLIRDSLLVGTGVFDEGRYFVANIKEGKNINTFGEYPFKDDMKDMSNKVLGMAYQSTLDFHKDGERFVSIATYSGNLEIASISPEKIVATRVRHHFFPPILNAVQDGGFLSVDRSPNSKTGFLSVAASDKNIFVLYSNKLEKENSMASNLIFVFDWDGRSVKILELDSDVRRIAADTNGSKLYAIKMNEKEFKFALSYLNI